MLLYVKMYGFRRALEELVSSRTDGQYSLVIKNSSVDVFDLNFTFQDVQIRKNRAVADNISHTVTIPRLRINFGSVASMLALEKFKIDNLEIDEPLITVESGLRDRRRTSSTLPQQIVKLYPAVESLLSRFEINSLSVKRGTLSLVKPNNTVTIRLIDLLVEHWNILHLDESSKLLLQVNLQRVDFGKVSLDFAQVEYDFQKRHLEFSRFTLATTDTVSASRVEVTAKSLLLNHLDYKELYENQRYVLQRAALDSPVVHAHFTPKGGKRNKWNREKGIVTRILKQTFGECMIDSTVIRNARLDLVFHKNNDSVTVNLPNVDFKLYSFRVVAGEESFQIGEMETNLNGTTISLKNDLSLRFNNIFIHNDRDVTVVNAALLDSDRKPVATIGTLQIDDADLLPFLFTKHFTAHCVHIENAVITIPERRSTKRPEKPADVKGIRVDNASLRNVTLYYRDSARRFSVKGIAAIAKRIHYDSNGVFSYVMDRVKVSQALLDVPGQRLRASINDVAIHDRFLNIETALVRKDSLDVTLRALSGEAVEKITAERYHVWKMFSVENATVHGVIPAGEKRLRPPASPTVFVHALTIARLDAAITNVKSEASFLGNDIRIREFNLDRERSGAANILGTFRNVDFHQEGLRVFAGNVNVNYPHAIGLTNVNIANKSIHVSLASLVSQGIIRGDDSWQLNAVRAQRVSVQRDHETFLESDGVHLRDVSVHSNTTPVIGAAEIFHPVFQSLSKEHKRHTGEQPQMVTPNKWIIHPGEWRTLHHHPVFFGRLEIDEEKNLVRCSYVHSEGEKMNIALRNINLIDHEMTIDSITLLERPAWIKSHTVEDDRINASLYHVKIAGVSRHLLMTRMPLRQLDVTVRGVDLDIRRDKRLPDPPSTAKPVILDRLVNLPARMRVLAFHLSDGHIRYTETSDKTGEEGFVDFTNVAADVKVDTLTSFLSMRASASPYGSGAVNVVYQTIDSTSFKLFLKASEIDLTKFNNVVVPFMPVRITSGYLKEYDLDITANADEAIGKATITYTKLHFQLVNKETPEKKNFKTELLTFIADDLVLRNKRNRAMHEVYQVRLKNRSIFNYWVKSIVSGAIGAVRKGKRERPRVD